ncbi:PfkB family carbohydrate kinase [Bauldia sp.]|uniref:PfkB family carbohydrate kinase n=1 Tax=Bauldia sp. TaxID=2575872 RepID=UPI003BA86742
MPRATTGTPGALASGSASDVISSALQDRLRRNRFVVIGRAGLDLYPDPFGTKIAEADRFRSDVGGSAGNIAVSLARLGAQASLISPLADDPVGRFTRNTLGRYGVDTALCRAIGGEYRNTLALAEIRSEDCEVVIYRNGVADFELSIADVAQIDHRSVGAVIATGTALAREPSREATLEAMRQARIAGTPTILDMDYRAYSWGSGDEAGRVYREAADLSEMLIGNDDEFGVAAGGRDRGESYARDLAAQAGALAVYKMGERGARTHIGNEVIETGIFPVETRKPFGAGDAFLGTLLASLAGGKALDEALERGAAAAALVVSRDGCASSMPDNAELAAFMASRTLIPAKEGA